MVQWFLQGNVSFLKLRNADFNIQCNIGKRYIGPEGEDRGESGEAKPKSPHI